MEGGGWAYLPFTPGAPVAVIRAEQRALIPPPASAGNGWSLSKDTLFVLSHTEEGGRERVWLNGWNLNANGATWERLAEIEADQGFPLVIFPLKKEDCYLAFNWAEGFVDKDGASFAAIFRMREGRLSLDALVDMPSPFSGLATRRFAWPAAESTGPQAAEPATQVTRFGCEATLPGLHPSLWAPASVRDFVFLAASKSAILWAFSTEEGRCKRVLNLGNLKEEELPRLGAMYHHLLAMQPTEDGSLLLATRNPEALQAAMEVNRLAGKAASKETLSRWTAYPKELRWFELDPMTWKVEADPTYRWPLPEAGDSFDQLSRFQFILDPKGRVLANLQGPWAGTLAEAGLDGKPVEEPLKPGTKPGTPVNHGRGLGSSTLTAAPARTEGSPRVTKAKDQTPE